MTQQAAPEAAKRYYSSADYYSEGQELVGLWGGKGAERLGLSGQVQKDAFDRLCDNLHPATGRALTPRNRTARTVGYDFTFDGPKSVSVLYALNRDEHILQAFRESVAETMEEIEADMKTRVRVQGRDENRHTGNLAWAEFIHFTARPVDGVPDPQLHAHCFAFNATWDGQEERWKAGQFQNVKRDMPYYQAAFHSRLAGRLKELGYGIRRDGASWEIDGVPESLITKFSRRDAQIEEEAKRRGITDPEQKAALAAKTRAGKEKALTSSELHKEWNARLTHAEQAALAMTGAGGEGGSSRETSVRESVDFALSHLFERSSVVSERRILAEALKHGVGSVSVEEVRGELAARPLIAKEQNGRRLATTREVLSEESRMLAFARQGRGRYATLGDPKRPILRDWLNQGQRAAVQHVLGSRDRVTLIRGAAGTGKTSMMQEAVEALAANERSVTVLAPSAEASRDVLRKAGFEAADTVARFLVDKKMQDAAHGGVIWVDEAGLLGVPTMSRLFNLAEELNARVILSGDRFQHGSVERGAALRLLEERAGVPVASITEIQRQEGDYKQAVRHLSEGRTEAGLAELERLGWVREVADAERYRVMAADYLKAVAEREKDGKFKTALVVSPTHAEGARITDAIREGLKTEGRLRKERSVAIWTPAHLTEAERGEAEHYREGDMLLFHQNAPGIKRGQRVAVGKQPLPLKSAKRFQVYRPGTLNLAVGDRVRVTAGGKTKDGKHRLDNGALLSVQGFTETGDIVVDHGWVIGSDFGHLAHGYVVTSHAAQGKTVNRVLIGQGSLSLPASSQEQFYVSVSRGRESATVYTDDRELLRSAVTSSDPSLSAHDLFADGEEGDRNRRHLSFLRRVGEMARARTHAAELHAAREVNYDRQ